MLALTGDDPVAEHVGTNSETSDSDATPFESFLIRYMRANPGLGFGAIVQAAQGACHVSRATAARYLSRLVRFGDVTILPDRTYVVGERTAPTPSRAVVEIRWYGQTLIVHPNGTARLLVEREFRVVSGQLDHVDFYMPKAPRQFIWWCSMAGRLSRIPATRTPFRMSTHRIDLAAPLGARNATWQRINLNLELPGWFRMAHASMRASRSSSTRPEQAHELESIEVPMHAMAYEQRVASDAQLRLQVVLPEGYPVGPAHFRVVLQTDPDRVDAAEQLRLDALAADKWHQDGLQRLGTTFTLSVPRPQLDRRYEIRWTLPTTVERDRWLAARRAPGSR